MAKTQLSPTATPGKIYAFVAKTAAAVAVGIVSAAFARKAPGAAFASKQPGVAIAGKQAKITYS